MHVPWGWVKQRPHFIAEGLNKKADITVVTIQKFSKGDIKNVSDVRVKSLFRFPLERIPLILWINTLLYRIQLKKWLKKADIVWFTSPYFVPFVAKTYFKEKVTVYDCMDDVLEFPLIKFSCFRLAYYERNEHFLFNRATILLSSAEYLKQKLIGRYGSRDDIMVVNNAIKEFKPEQKEVVLPVCLQSYRECRHFKLVYIGTISSWMDFPLLRKILSYYQDMEVFLFGPSEISIPTIERMTYGGKLEHDVVFKVMEIADVLIMPFVVNELIKSVNPVKLYEYIYSGKPCVAPSYGESQSFKDYVYLYSDSDECLSIIKNLRTAPKGKADVTACRDFCRQNTWNSRLADICKVLKI